MSRQFLMLFTACWAFVAQTSALQVEPGSLRADGLSQFLGLPDPTPRLSWRLSSTMRGDRQTAYRIQAASDESNINNADLWDTGKVTSTSQSIIYAGSALGSRAITYWRVQTWDKNDEPSDWSEVTTFELALRSSSDWSASWIANTQYSTGTNSLPAFAKNFSVSCPVSKGRLYLLGLGQHEAKVNGKLVSDEVLAPGYSTVATTLLYSTYNITSLLQNGDNVVGVELGKGQYDPEPGLGGRYMRYTTAAQQLKLIAQLEWSCEDGTFGTIVSDGSWLTTVDGPLVESSFYGGEEYDARKVLGEYTLPGTDLSKWSYANTTTAPTGEMTTPATPPLRIVETISAQKVTQVGSQWLFDFGVNFAGWYEISMTGLEGQRVVLTPGESLTSAGLVAQAQWTTGTPIYDAYTFASSNAETYKQKFMYHGLQYLMVNLTTTPKASDLVGYVIRTDNEVVGTLDTSNSLFNNIHKIIDRSVQSNMFSVLTDCPHREKWGWLEESQLVFDAFARAYDVQAFGKNFARTIANAQTSSGLIPSTAPEYLVQDGAYRDDPNWGGAMILMPYKLYQYYGEVEVLSQNYDIMYSYMNYLKGKSSDNMLSYGLGDWVASDTSTPLGITATLAYAKLTEAMATIAKVLGKTSDATYFASLHSDTLNSFHSTFFNSTSNNYGSGSQASNAIALDIGAVPSSIKPAVLSNLVNSIISNGYHMTVGEIALPSLIRALQDGGHDDLLFEMMSLTTSKSYGFMVTSGATSLWEEWDAITDGGSRNHFMLGYPDVWLYSLSGISQVNTSVGFTELQLKPVVVGDLTFSSSTYRSSQGLISASWALASDKSLTYNVTVPVGSTAQVILNGTVTEGGTVLDNGSDGIVSISKSGNTNTITIGSGKYIFQSK